jgi:hypothetical protein
MKDRHRVEPAALALLGLAFLAFAVFGIVYLANFGEPDLLRDYPWLIIDVTLGALAFMWGFVVLLTEYPAVQTVAVGLLVVISCLVAPMGLMFALVAARATGGGD